MTELSATGEPAAPDHVGLALKALVAGVLAGLAAVAATMWLVRTLQVAGAAPLAPRPSDAIANLVLFGWLGGALVGAMAAWAIMAPIASAYRRGAFAMVAGFGSLVVAFVTAPVDRVLGRWGLLGLTTVAVLVALAVASRARRGVA
jgi:hypothetical protein